MDEQRLLDELQTAQTSILLTASNADKRLKHMIEAHAKNARLIATTLGYVEVMGRKLSSEITPDDVAQLLCEFAAIKENLLHLSERNDSSKQENMQSIANMFSDNAGVVQNLMIIIKRMAYTELEKHE